MGLTAANLALLGGAAGLYWYARRRLFVTESRPGRRRELIASTFVAALAIGAFALAHAGMNASWTGRGLVTDLHWLFYGLVFAGAVLGAHAVLRLQQSRVDELVLPVAAFLTALGLVNVYVWETRDANAYVTTVALPALRDYQDSLAASKREHLAQALGPIPNEIEFERRPGRFATILNPEWLAAYNDAARRLETVRAALPRERAVPAVHAVQLDGRLRRQLFAACLAVLLVPAVIAVASWRRVPSPAAAAVPLLGGALLLALVATSAASSANRRLPALVGLAGHYVTVYELLKLALVVVVGVCIASRGRWPSRIGLSAAAVAIAAMVWRDPGAGLALAAVAALMAMVVAGRRWRFGLVALATVGLAVLPLATRALEPYLPTTVPVRMEMWADPWGSFERAQVENSAAAAVARIAAYRAAEPQAARALSAVAPDAPPTPDSLQRDVDEIERELRWRVDALDGRTGGAKPLVPGADPVESLLLLEAERLWSDLGGFRSATGSDEGSARFHARLDDAMRVLRAEASRREAGIAPDDFQLQRSQFALRAGGVAGVGFGRGRPEAIPGLTEDVPLAAVGEALGLAGVVLVVLFVLLLTGRGMSVARTQPSPAAGLVAAGLSALLGIQALVSLGGLSGVLPFTGLTFPLLSRSGTALVSVFAGLALLMSIAARVPASPAPRGRGSRLVEAAGLPAAFALVTSSIALVQLTGHTLTAGPALAALPGPNAPLLHARDQWASRSYATAPGPILDRSGRVLAYTASLGGRRIYPEPRLARGLGHTLLQLDFTLRDVLRRPHPANRRKGPALVTTIDAGVQRAVGEAIDRGSLEAGLADVGTLRGAAVVLDVTDGAIVALQSRPAFSLAELADPVAWARAEARERRLGFPYRYLNRVVDGYYPPGSIFKTVTAAAALERGLHSLHSRDFDYRHGPTGRRPPDYVDQLGAWHQLPLADGLPITDGNHPHLDDWRLNLEEAFAWSCNVAFAELGLELGAADLVEFAHRFGFERRIAVPGLGSFTSTLDNDWRKDSRFRFLARGPSSLARTAFGQGEARVTPLQMALVPAAIANGGTIMRPHIVAGWRSEDGRWLRRTPSRVLVDTGLSSLTIAELGTMMRASATYGWARRAQLNANNANPGVAGKTGSAEWSETLDASHAWFIGYFPVEAPRLAVAVVVERGGSGPTMAARIARHIFGAGAVQQYLRQGDGR